MKIMKIAFACLVGIAGCSCSGNSGRNTSPEPGFKYLADEFADLKVIRYRLPGWDDLTLKQKSFIYYLGEAAKSGRDIFWDQNFKYNLAVRKCLENILETYSGDRDTPEFSQFLTYAKRVFFSNGIHHHYAEDKILPECSSEYMLSLIQNSQDSLGEELLAIMCDPALYPRRESNFYGDVSLTEAEAFYEKMSDRKDPRPVEYGLNSKLIKKDGQITEDIYRIDGLYGPAITQICHWLEKAAEVSETPQQAACLKTLIEYYKTGDLKSWDQFNIAWSQDTLSEVDFVNGFVEVYADPLGMKGAWEANVNYIDKEASKRTSIISANAQWFEDHSPIDPRFRKSEVRGVSAKVINVAMLGGDAFPSTPIGINLPNSDWIRKEYGSKSVTIANISNAYDRAAEESPKNMIDEFSWDSTEVALLRKYGSLTGDLHTDLHECLGHGSGQLLPGTSPNALKGYSSPLEESRADLFALYYIADPKMTELGILPDGQAYKAEYINYIRNGLFTQLVRIEEGKDVTQAHMQCRQLIASWCYEKGQKDNVIEKKVRDGKTYFVINDFDALRNLFGELLAEMQRIKSEGDYLAGKNMVETYGVKTDPVLHKEVRARYAALELRPYGGFMNPDIIPVTDKKGQVTDYRIEYAKDFIQQHLAYGKAYSFL